MRRSADRGRWTAKVFYAAAGLLVLLTAWGLVEYFTQPDRQLIARDYQLYMDATSRWLGGGPFYDPRQLSGPYSIEHGDVLYPPTALPLFIIFTALPAWTWWAVPIVGTAAIVVRHRPSPIAWLGIALCLWFPATAVKVLTGNPVLWVVLAAAGGTVWGWPGVWVLLKPSLFPFALIGIWRRSWWISLGVMVVVALLLLDLTRDWVTALQNSSNPEGLLYSMQELPMVAVPLLAWLGRTARTSAIGRREAGPGTSGHGPPVPVTERTTAP